VSAWKRSRQYLWSCLPIDVRVWSAVAEHLDAARIDILAFIHQLPQSHLAPDRVQKPQCATSRDGTVGR
jgi:hypothetical protein